jgi:hypothetical protein
MLLGSFLILLATTLGSAQQPTVFAAPFPQHFRAEVCGLPALATTVQSAIEGAIREGMKGAPNLDVTFTTSSCQPLFPNQKATYYTQVLATAPNCIQASGTVAVTIQNSGVPIGREHLLWFCNKPENLRTSGPLFDGALSSGEPIRLLYHHQNRGSQPLYMRIELVNAADKPARVWIIPGDGRPNRDPVWSGLKAARTFLPELLVGSGELIKLPAHSAVPIGFRRLVEGDTASGLCTLKLDSGGPATLEVRAEAILPVELASDWASAMLDPAPWHWVKPHEVYNPVAASYEITPLVYLDPFVEAPLAAAIGGPASRATFGVEGIPRLGGGRGLNGNYAVLHTFDVSLSNPTSAPGHVEFWLDATTNYTAAVLAFPSRLIWLRPLQKGESRLFLTIRLAPGEHRNFKVRTMPVSGGWYPATIRLKPVVGN